MNCPVKIALVANTCWNLYNFRRHIILGLINNGFEVLCIAPEDAFTTEIQKLPVTYIPITLQAKGNNPLLDAMLVKQLAGIYKKQQPDIVLHYTIKPNIYGSFAAAIAGIPVINTVTGLGTVFLHENVVSKIAQVLYKWSFRFANYVVFQNDEDKNVFIDKKLLRNSQPIIIRGSGIDISRFKSLKNDVKDSPFRFLMVARLLYDKGIREFGAASKMLYHMYGPAVECVLVGAIESDKNLGISKQALGKWVEEHHVIYKPFTTNIIEEYQLASVVVLPSYREGLSKSLLEAASCSKPLIATNVAGCKEIVLDSKNGFLCEPKDLFLKMQQMLACSQEQLVEMGVKSRIHVEESFSDKTIFNDYFCLVNKLLTKDK
jgi:glycosyltransferase involved in cell wall biosynthesis